jgi:Flp pilus assembly pilin Flp
MKQIKSWIAGVVRDLPRREEGQGLVEYSIILGAIAVGAIVILQAIGGYVTSTLNTVKNAL